MRAESKIEITQQHLFGIAFRQDLKVPLSLKSQQIVVTTENASFYASTAEWFPALVAILILKPFAEEFLKTLGGEAGKKVAALLVQWFKGVKSADVLWTSLGDVTRAGRVRRGRFAPNIIMITIPIACDDTVNNFSFIFPRNMREKDIPHALSLIRDGEFPQDTESRLLVFEPKRRFWERIEEASVPKLSITGDQLVKRIRRKYQSM